MTRKRYFIGGISKLADILFISPATIRNWMSKGMPYFRVGLEINFETDKVADWLEATNKEKYQHLANLLDLLDLETVQDINGR